MMENLRMKLKVGEIEEKEMRSFLISMICISGIMFIILFLTIAFIVGRG